MTNIKWQNRKRRAVPTFAAIILLLAPLASISFGGSTTCAATNVGCESGASAGLGSCSLLGMLYRKTYIATWACGPNNQITNQSCDQEFDTDNCCGIPNKQICPAYVCPCPNQGGG
jgi:hypothetical protein